MGARYELNLSCAYCGEYNPEVYYAPTCGFLSFHCCVCKKENWIEEGFYAEKITPEESEKRHFIEGFFDESPYLPEVGVQDCICTKIEDVGECISNACPIHGREAQKKVTLMLKEKYGIKETLPWEESCGDCLDTGCSCAENKKN